MLRLRLRPALLHLTVITVAGVCLPTEAFAVQTGGTRSACASDGDWTAAPVALSVHVDSAMLATALRPRWNPDWDRVIATIRPPRDSTEVGDQVWLGTRADDTEGLDNVGAWLLQGRTGTPIPDRESVRILIGDGGEFDLRAVEFRECEPLLATRARVGDEMARLGRKFRHVFEARELALAELVLWMWVDENGEVGDVRVNEPSLISELDIEVAEAFRRHARFDPARVEGITRAVWVSIPVTVRPPR